MKLDQANIIVVPTDERLYKKASKVKDVNSVETFAIVQRMIQLQKETGIGLAANQLGIDRQIMTVKAPNGEIVEFINARLINDREQSFYKNEDIEWMQEGCLSHPGILVEVGRYKRVMIAAYQIRTGNKEMRFILEGEVARIFQHELCHLNGLLITDMGPYSRNIMPISSQATLLKANSEFEQKDFVLE